ncbi:MAG TPA: hypothetical protein VMV15_08130 [Candidatus Binataceae bacterium]|nr:hypothetical protein [Candidatus Binataceae bacterium]
MSFDAPNPLLLDLIAPPWRRYEIVTRSSPGEVIAAVRDATEERRYFRLPSSDARDLEGTVEDDSFAVSRIIGYRNSLRPLIIGRVAPGGTGTRIAIGMRLQWSAAFGVVAAIGMIVTTFILTQTAFHGLQSRSAGLGVVAAMIVAGYLMITVPFGLEARRACAILRRLWHIDGPRQSVMHS